MKQPSRRPRGDGSLSTSADRQVIVARITLPDGSRRKSTIRRTKGETPAQHRKRAEIVLDSMLTERDAGRTTSGIYTVSGVSSQWLESIRGSVADSTHAHYSRIAAYYVTRYIGSKQLAALTIEDVEQLDATLRQLGKGHATRKHARQTLARVLRYARKRGYVANVVTDLADPVKGAPRNQAQASSRTRAQKALTPAQLADLLEAAKGHRLEALVAAIVYTGMRRGEALGLSWDAVDLNAATIEIRRALSTIDPPNAPARVTLAEPKTRGSWRTIDLPAALVTVLRSWKARQAQERLALGVDYSGAMIDHEGHRVALVFTDELGRVVEPDDVRRLFDRLGSAAGIGHVHPHQLRHSVASVRIAAGEDPVLVGDQLGHANPSITLSTYSHSYASARKRAASTVADAIAAIGRDQ